MPDYLIKHGGGSRSNGGTPRFFQALAKGELWRWAFAPEFEWSVPITAAELSGPAATQLVTVTIPASGFVSGRLTLTFTGYGLSSPVDVVADAAVADANTDLATTLEAAIATARGTTLAGVVADESVTTNVVAIQIVRGLSGTVTATWRSAQVITIGISGAPVTGNLYTTISGGGLGAPVVVPTAVTAGQALTSIIAARETSHEALIATTLAGVLVSADDNGVNLNTLQFEPDITDVVITTYEDPSSWTVVFGGTPTDGNYTTTIEHSSLAGGSVSVTTPRSGGSPAANTDLAAQHETDLQAEPALYGLLSTAAASGTQNRLIFLPGVTEVSVSTSAPSPGTLVASELMQAVNDVTPAGPAIAVAYSVEIDLASIPAATLSGAGAYTQGARGGFPSHVDRGRASIDVVTAFGAGRTLTLGDETEPAGLLGATPVDLNTAGRTLTSASEAEYRLRYEAAFAPLVTVVLGSSATVAAGRAVVGIVCSPVPFEAAG